MDAHSRAQVSPGDLGVRILLPRVCIVLGVSLRGVKQIALRKRANTKDHPLSDLTHEQIASLFRRGRPSTIKVIDNHIPILSIVVGVELLFRSKYHRSVILRQIVP